MILMFGEEIIQSDICLWFSEWKNNGGKANDFMINWHVNRFKKVMVLNFKDFIAHVRKQIDGFEGIHKRNSFNERNVEREI